ncbi:unnamed protein product [Parnassius mnemosyne]|uniref:Meckelin n=1 Tax=Parnassius mnemosyne TaxID=213953 RepID=A0AAV1KSK0_9NEOP
MFMFSSKLNGLHSPNCSSVEFFEASSLNCRPCPANSSMTASEDGLSCICENDSIKTELARCRVCNVTEVVSADGYTCVPRRCQLSSGRIVCRKCPNDYISVTQNHDGTPLTEVQCVKCARGYKVQNNICTKCEICACNRNEVIVHGKCLPKKYVMQRPRYEEKRLHPSDLLDIVKYEYMCINSDVAACRWLANACVSNFYSSDPAGPCRLWIFPNLVTHKILPTLTNKSNKSSSDDKDSNEINLSKGQNSLLITAISYENNGKFKYLHNPGKKFISCFPPFTLTIGENYSYDCKVNVSELSTSNNELFTLFTTSDENMTPISIKLRKPNGHIVQKGLWPLNEFTKYFLYRRSLSATANITDLIYLRVFLISLRIERKQQSFGSLKLHINFEAQYAVKFPFSDIFSTSLIVTHILPSAGVLRGLEIWGSILSILMAIYAIAQWRGVLRRGGLQISLLPLIAGCIADALYFATWSSVMHALAAEAGTLELTLPLSQSEERVIEGIIYAIVALKVVKVAYVNWIQCRCDIYFIDWSEYTPYFKDTPINEQSNTYWKPAILAREWAAMQTKRRTSPVATVTLTLLILNLMKPWQAVLPKSQGYNWAVASIAWWTSYTVAFLGQMIVHRVFGSPLTILPKICSSIEFSLLVFQEDLYAHYVHGRNDNTSEARYLSGPLTTCRVVCATQFRAICKQLLAAGERSLENTKSKQILITRFLGAFFERALDGLSWVAKERTILEKLLDIELIVREGSTTSILLYDAQNSPPSCFTITWWGAEWTLATLDAMMFGSVLYATNEPMLAALTILTLCQIMKYTVTWFVRRNVRVKTNIESF